MEDQNSDNQQEKISLQDSEIVIKIIEKALSYREEFIKDAVIGEKLQALSLEEQTDEALTSRLNKWYFGKVPCVFLRFVGNETPLVEAIFYPIEAVYSFLESGRRRRKEHRKEGQTDEDVESLAFEDAVDMFLIMLDNFYQRGMLMMDSFTNETIAQFHHISYKRFLRNNIAAGNKIETIKYNAVNEAIDEYLRKLKTQWEQHGQNDESWKKLSLSEEYEPIHNHWKMIRIVYRKGGSWREYAKISGFEDTFDDLLDKLENTDLSKLSELAMEHAARRVGLLKQSGIRDSVLEKRRKGIPETDYTYPQLKCFANEGKEIAKRLEKIREFEQNREFVKVKNRKLVEQNLKFIKDQTEKSS